jgi:hypothetical protein
LRGKFGRYLHLSWVRIPPPVLQNEYTIGNSRVYAKNKDLNEGLDLIPGATNILGNELPWSGVSVIFFCGRAVRFGFRKHTQSPLL